MAQQVPTQKKTNLWNEGKIKEHERFVLKRSAGIMMDSAPAQAVAVYYMVKNEEEQTSKYRDEIRFACLCMSCLWDKGTAKRSFQELVAEACRGLGSGKTMRNICIEALDEPWRRDGYLLDKICRMVTMLRKINSSVMPDFERLAEDLSRWNNDTKYVQRNWIETIFS